MAYLRRVADHYCMMCGRPAMNEIYSDSGGFRGYVCDRGKCEADAKLQVDQHDKERNERPIEVSER